MEAFQTASEVHIDFGESASSAARRYTVGPMLRLSLPRGFGLEVDALYQRLGYDYFSKPDEVDYLYTRVIGHSWEFPILGTYRFLKRLPFGPYASGGIALRTTGADSISGISVLITMNQIFPLTEPPGDILSNRSDHGLAVAVGGQLRAGRLGFSPEFRYTRWAGDTNPDIAIHSNQNQAEILFGFTFKAH